MRLQKYLAHAGVASRRKAEVMISRGRVAVNGKIIRTQGTQVEPGDLVEVDGRPVDLDEPKTSLVLNKPRNIISTASDEKGRRTVLDFVKDYEDLRLYPVGRLDRNSSGLIVLTNDGDLAQVLTHPSYGVKKTYEATVEGEVSPETAMKLSKGIELEDGPTAPASFRIKEVRKNKTRMTCQIGEGRNRQIRRMFEAVGHPVLDLKRTAVGKIRLGRLPSGQTRPLNNGELKWIDSLKD